jgi:serine O-acetyltransferase
MDHHLLVSAEQPDWSREARRPWTWTPSQALVASVRDYQKRASNTGLVARFAQKVAVLRHRFWSVVTGADIPLNCQIGGGLLIPHPNGIVINPGAKIGVNCLIFQQVTIGASRRGLPTIGGHVDIGAGAKIIGPITIGNHVIIGANAVVVFDVPDGGVVMAPAAQIGQTASAPRDPTSTDEQKELGSVRS